MLFFFVFFLPTGPCPTELSLRAGCISNLRSTVVFKKLHLNLPTAFWGLLGTWKDVMMNFSSFHHLSPFTFGVKAVNEVNGVQWVNGVKQVNGVRGAKEVNGMKGV